MKNKYKAIDLLVQKIDEAIIWPMFYGHKPYKIGDWLNKLTPEERQFINTLKSDDFLTLRPPQYIYEYKAKRSF